MAPGKIKIFKKYEVFFAYLTSKYDKLALLVSIGEDLKTVGHHGQELYIVAL